MNTLIFSEENELVPVVIVWNNGQLDGATIEEIPSSKLDADLLAVLSRHDPENSCTWFSNSDTIEPHQTKSEKIMKNSKANFIKSWVATANQYESLAIQARRDHFEEAKQLVTDIQSKVEELATLASLAQFDGVVSITLGNMHQYTSDAALLEVVATHLLQGAEIIFHEKEIKMFIATKYMAIR